MLKVWIGYDPNETVAFHVLAHSIYKRATQPVLISGVKKEQVPIWRERDPKQSTEFSFSRFLVPYLSNYEGYSIFMDCDMLMLADINEVMQFASPKHAVSVCKHDYVPRETTKFLDAQQTKYRRKNWSAFMLFNNAACRNLTPDYVNSATGLELHQFNWCPDAMIGELPLTWNWLVGEDNQAKESPNNIHWTKGGPWFPAYADADFAELWREEYRQMCYATPYGAYKKTDKEAA
jgi:lipopolysaccharide biosynthesis glycosyltransferase